MPYTANTVSDILGFTSSTNPQYANLSEEDKLIDIKMTVHKLTQTSEEDQDVLWSEFCAAHLHETVKAFLNPPSAGTPKNYIADDFVLQNAYMETMRAAQHVPYFSKYIRSVQEGQELAQSVAERLVAVGSRWAGYMRTSPPRGVPNFHYPDIAGAILSFYSTLLASATRAANPTDKLKPDTKRRLLSILHEWARVAPLGVAESMFLREVCSRTIGVLTNPTIVPQLNNMRRQLKNWEACGMPYCGKRDGLKACARCGTIRYCSAEHQKQHWKLAGPGAHKRFCFKTIGY